MRRSGSKLLPETASSELGTNTRLQLPPAKPYCVRVFTHPSGVQSNSISSTLALVIRLRSGISRHRST